MIERFADQLNLSTVFKEVIRLELAGLLVSVSMARAVFLQLLANWLFFDFRLPVAAPAVSSFAIFGKFSRNKV